MHIRDSKWTTRQIYSYLSSNTTSMMKLKILLSSVLNRPELGIEAVGTPFLVVVAAYLIISPGQVLEGIKVALV